MMKGFSLPLCSSLAIIKQSAAGTWGCGWIRGGEEEQSRMLSMSSTPQRRRRGREGGQHGGWFALCLCPLLHGFFSISFFLLLLCLQLLSQICCIHCGISIFLENQILYLWLFYSQYSKSKLIYKDEHPNTLTISYLEHLPITGSMSSDIILCVTYLTNRCFLYEFAYLRFVTLLSVAVYVPMCTVMSQHQILKV